MFKVGFDETKLKISSSQLNCQQSKLAKFDIEIKKNELKLLHVYKMYINIVSNQKKPYFLQSGFANCIELRLF